MVLPALTDASVEGVMASEKSLFLFTPSGKRGWITLKPHQHAA